MVTSSTKQTEAVLKHHLESLAAGNAKEILADYAADAVLFTPNATVRGQEQIGQFFMGMQELVSKLVANLKMVRQDVDGEIAYIVWTAGDVAPLGTDTFVVRNGKIVAQTFAAHLPQ